MFLKLFNPARVIDGWTILEHQHVWSDQPKHCCYPHVSPAMISNMFVYTVITIVETMMSKFLPMLLVIVEFLSCVAKNITFIERWEWHQPIMINRYKQWFLIFPTLSWNSSLSSLMPNPPRPQDRGAWAAEQTAQGLRLSQWMPHQWPAIVKQQLQWSST